MRTPQQEGWSGGGGDGGSSREVRAGGYGCFKQQQRMEQQQLTYIVPLLPGCMPIISGDDVQDVLVSVDLNNTPGFSM